MHAEGRAVATRFAVVSDTHFRYPPVGDDGMWWNRMLQSRTAELADALVRLTDALQPDFVVHAGDITDRGDESSHEFALRTFARIGCPVACAPGNHDTFEPGVRELFGEAYGATAASFSSARNVSGVRVLLLDAAWWIWSDGAPTPAIDWERYGQDGTARGIGPSDGDLAWLDGELGRPRECPVVLVTHAPVHSKPIVPAAVHHPPGMTPPLNRYGPRHEELRAVMAKHPPVDVVAAGHMHYHDLTPHDGTLHCTTAALVEYPCEVRMVEVDEEHITVRTVGLDDERFARDSFVEGWDHRWPAGATEADRTLTVATALRAPASGPSD